MRLLLAGFFLAALSAVAAPPPGYSSSPAWADEFDGTTLDAAKWNYRTDSKMWSSQRPENVEVSGGTLKLHLKKEDSGGKSYTGGGVISKEAFRYGYYEARLKIPPGAGWHTSFWMMLHNGGGGTGPKAACQELDVIENDSIHRQSYGVNVHKWKDGHEAFGGKMVKTPDLSADFHLFGCEFTPGAVRYYFDGKLVQTVDVTTAREKDGRQSGFEHGDQNIWLTAIASSLGGTRAVEDSKVPATAEFDYVRYFTGNETPGPSPFDPQQPAACMQPFERRLVPPPKPHFLVRDFGAKGDGTTFDTAAIQKAIDACAGTGGSVIVSAGQYVSAPLELKGRMTFHVEKNAVILGSLNPADYPVRLPKGASSSRGNQRSLLFAEAADDLVIDGPGTVDGRGRDLAMDGVESMRPSLIRIFNSRNVIVRNVTFRNPRMWTAVYAECRNLRIEGTVTDSPAYCPNLDGMDICDSQDVVIRNNFVRSEDDAICLKTGGASGLKNILIENNVITSIRANAIKLGTGTRGPVENLRIVNNTVDGAAYGGLCIESVDGSVVRDVLVRGLDLYRTGQPIFVRLDHRKTGPPETPPPKNAPPVGSMTGVTIERVRALGTHDQKKTSISSLTGIPTARLGSVVLRDVFLEVPGGLTAVPTDPGDRSGGYPQSNIFGPSPASVLYVRYADDVKLERVQWRVVRPDVRPWLVTRESRVTTEDCRESTKAIPVPSPQPAPTSADFSP